MPPFEIPKFFRILIIDDLIGKNKAYQDLIENIFFSLVTEASGYDKNFNFEICFTDRPDNGLKLWQDEIFDLTLIDADFTQYEKTGSDADPLSYALNSRYQGVHILSLLKRFVQEKEKYSYRKKNCEFYLWSGLEKEELEKALEVYGIENIKKISGKLSKEYSSLIKSICNNSLSADQKGSLLSDLRKKCCNKSGEEKEEDSLLILKYEKEKEKGNLENIHKKISPLINLIKDNDLDCKHKVERLLFALRKNYNDIIDNLFGGCLIYDAGDQFNFLSELTKIGNISIRVCPGRIPSKLFETDESLFLPLHRKVFEGNLRESVRYLLDKWQNELSEYCDQLKKRDKKTFFPNSTSTEKSTENLLGFSVKNQFIASASPLTGISVIGENRAREALKGKVKALLDGPFGAVVLKTTYLDNPKQWENVFWPGLQIQTHMRTRCLYPDTGSPTLWNTGRTAVEMLPPASLNKFLLDISEDDRLKDDTYRIIISMGSKFPQTKSPIRLNRYELEKRLKEIWKDFFELIFKNLPNDTSFPLIEINVRHYLREIIEYYLGGDEYLNPIGFEQKDKPDIEGFWNEFKVWIWVIYDLAVEYKKRLILKFPHRSDVLAYVGCAVALRELHLATCKEKEREYGIRGFTLVNALKSPVPKAGIDDVESTSAFSNIPFTPDWYANPDAWSDAWDKKFKYQMSGRFVGPYRNQILAGISSEFDRIKDLGMEIFVSGGITSKKDIEFIQALSQKHPNIITGIQIGTWGLLNTELGQKSWANVSEPPKPARPDYIKFKLDVKACKGICYSNCLVYPCPCNALERNNSNHKLFFINEELCDTCTSYDCDQKCKFVKLKPISDNIENLNNSEAAITHPGMSDVDKNAILPRISFLNEKICKACGACSHTFYCDSFIDRANDELPPLMDSRNCSGCGLCVQVCSSGALQLYKPEEMLILISKSEERRDILRKLGIPFLAYDPEDDINNFAIFKPEFTERLKGIAKGESEEKGTTLKQLVKNIWDKRLGLNSTKKDKYLLSSDEQENINRDKREDRRDFCKKTAEDLIGRLQTETIKEHRLALVRVIIWSQLIWSDPGQIFWDSFIMTIQSYLCCADGEYIGETEIDDLIDGDKNIIIANYVVLLHKGRIVFNESLKSELFKISNNMELLEKYKNSNFGEGRLAGLDFRTSSKFLLKNPEIPHSELLALAGLPWEEIKEKIKKMADEGTKTAFEKLLNAVARRTYN